MPCSSTVNSTNVSLPRMNPGVSALSLDEDDRFTSRPDLLDEGTAASKFREMVYEGVAD